MPTFSPPLFYILLFYILFLTLNPYEPLTINFVWTQFTSLVI